MSSDKVVKQIAACGFHTGAITSNGELYTWYVALGADPFSVAVLPAK